MIHLRNLIPPSTVGRNSVIQKNAYVSVCAVRIVNNGNVASVPMTKRPTGSH